MHVFVSAALLSYVNGGSSARGTSDVGSLGHVGDMGQILLVVSSDQPRHSAKLYRMGTSQVCTSLGWLRSGKT